LLFTLLAAFVTGVRKLHVLKRPLLPMAIQVSHSRILHAVLSPSTVDSTRGTSGLGLASVCVEKGIACNLIHKHSH